MIRDNDEPRQEYVENAFSRLKEDGRVEGYWSGDGAGSWMRLGAARFKEIATQKVT